MVIRQAVVSDLEVLFTHRLEFLKDMRNHEITISEEFKQHTYEHLREHMEDGTMAVWLAENREKIISTAIISYYQILPTLSNPSGKCGYVQNVYTCPEYRRKGIATRLLNRMLEDARDHNVGRVYLSATDMGKPVYQQLGFEPLTNDMAYQIAQRLL